MRNMPVTGKCFHCGALLSCRQAICCSSPLCISVRNKHSRRRVVEARLKAQGPKAQERGTKMSAKQNMSPSPAGKSKAGSQGNVGPSTKMSSCAPAGAAKWKGGVPACGQTGKHGASPNVSGSRGNG